VDDLFPRSSADDPFPVSADDRFPVSVDDRFPVSVDDRFPVSVLKPGLGAEDALERISGTETREKHRDVYARAPNPRHPRAGAFGVRMERHQTS
jgi:hypothetical protein